MHTEHPKYFKDIPLRDADLKAIENFMNLMVDPIMGRPLTLTLDEALSHQRFFNEVQQNSLAKTHYEELVFKHKLVVKEADGHRGMLRLLTRYINTILFYNGQRLNQAPLCDPLVRPFNRPLTDNEGGSIASFYVQVRCRFIDLYPNPTNVSNYYWFNYLKNIKEHSQALHHFQTFLYYDGFLGKEYQDQPVIYSQTTWFVEAVLACLADEVLRPEVNRIRMVDMIDRHLADETAPIVSYSMPVSPEDRKVAKHEQVAMLNHQIAEKVKRRNELMWEINPDSYVPPEEGWVCFHCGEHFPTEETAREHFGATPESIAGCVLTKRENGILGELRALEAKYEALRKKVDDGNA